MFSVAPAMGGWCLFQNGSGTLHTYRLPNAAKEAFIASAFSADQASYASAIQPLKIDVSPGSNYLDYLDAFHCGATGGPFVCYNYQPTWTDLGESDGYPRFGRGDPV